MIYIVGSKIPRDKVLYIIRQRGINDRVFFVIVCVSLAGIISSVFFLWFNYHYRKLRYAINKKHSFLELLFEDYFVPTCRRTYRYITENTFKLYSISITYMCKTDIDMIGNFTV
jgi:hypothetical protein